MNADAPPLLLVVDDDRLVLTVISSGLRDAGYDVREAESGEEAIECIDLLKPEVAILDMRMPGMGGMGLARHLAAHTHVDFMFLTAYNDTDLAAQAAELGAMAYLVKPLDVRQIVPMVHTVLARSRERREQRKRWQIECRLALATGMLMEQRRVGETAARMLLLREAVDAGLSAEQYAEMIVDERGSTHRPNLQ